MVSTNLVVVVLLLAALTKVVHVARKLDTVGKRKAAGADPSGPEGARKKLLLSQKGLRPGMNSLAGHAGKPGTGNSTNSVGMGRNKCGECGQVFDSIKEISLHMQRHLAEKVPHEKNSVVTLTHRPKDGSLPSKATITQVSATIYENKKLRMKVAVKILFRE